MTWAEFFKWYFVIILGIGSLGTVYMIGRPRRPITGGVAIFVVIINVIEMVAVLKYWS